MSVTDFKKVLYPSVPWEDDDGDDVSDEPEDGDGRQEDALDDEAERRSLFGGLLAETLSTV